MTELVIAAGTLLASLGPILAKSLKARSEEHAAILIEAQTAGAEFLAAVDGLVARLLTNDREADEALAKKFDKTDTPK